VNLSLPAQPTSGALLVFSKLAGIEVLFPFDELSKVQSPEVRGRFEPEDALNRLLRDTGFAARRNGSGKFVVTRAALPTGAITGRLLAPDGRPAAGVRVTLPEARQSVVTNARGGFDFPAVLPGSHRLYAAGLGYQLLQLPDVKVEAGRVSTLTPATLQSSEEASRLDPYLVEGRSASLRPFDHSQTLGTPLRAAGNLDLPRSENGALPYTIYDRDQISRSGVVDLNEFLQRELLESDAATRPPGSGTSVSDFINGSTNLNLRGFGADQTVILVNGRRVPEVLITGAPAGAPDVNFIPLRLVQQIDVLPVSASSLYSGNAVGGVINIVLRPEPDTNTTEVTTTYTNALRGFDAPQTAVSLVHSRSLLDGRLRLRLQAAYSRTTPPTEAELHHRQSRPASFIAESAPLYRATPNLRSADGRPLFGDGAATVTSVAPGADGTGGLAAFAGRPGLRNFTLFDSPGRLSISPDSLDFPYGLRQQRRVFAGSLVHDPFPWLQLGADAAWSHTVVNRGFDVFRADLLLAQNNPLNPFGRDAYVSLLETAPALGEHYSEARVDSVSAVLGALLKLPADWRAVLDLQYARNLVRYRGLFGVNADRWQALVDRGAYNPLRDTQAHEPPAAFYDEALLFLGGRGRFASLGDYQTIDAAARLANQNLSLPTGPGAINLGADYRRNQLARYTQELRYADGSPAADPEFWTGRTLQRYSVFAEVQGPLLPPSRLPRWVRALEADLAVRYIASANAKESNTAPTLALKLETADGLTFRGSVSTSSRIPTPQLTRRVVTGGGEGGGNFQTILDPVRNERYAVQILEDFAPNLTPEDSVTQTAGVIFKRGKTHRLRAALDFVDTRKVNEVIVLQPQNVVDVEAMFPERVQRAPLPPGYPHATGPIASLVTGAINTDRRHSQNWNAALDYSWTECAGGMLDFHTRWVWYQRYDRRVFAFSPEIDELGAPDGLTSAVLRYRANLGAGWSNPAGGFGLDGHYFHSRVLPAIEWASQGATRINPYWQFDAYAHVDLARWLPGKKGRYGLRAQLRVNNLLGADFPPYANEGSGSGVQPYGDWRNRVYSLSVTATF
jgi:outer membrane receptor protein involved in Fe transport